eukprot:TRINITY_DN11753_c0_g1_i1.p1 TRINITY_DN11753_c0_g1~~TRINITY_DN11753_c0_g1_i1.p1  ORF type:complete len:375 (+),score=70.97 TRINITY_DN11753_c0_g1_i1:105-1127(+)
MTAAGDEPQEAVVIQEEQELAPEEAKALAHLQDLQRFKRWSIFLPRWHCEEVESNAVYFTAKQFRDPSFFDKTRNRLNAILADCDLLEVSGVECTISTGIVEALDAVLQGLLTALGFLTQNQFHKAIALGVIMVQVTDRITEGRTDLTFWRMLSRASLGDAYVRLRRRDEARDVLNQAIRLGQEALQSRLASSTVTSEKSKVVDAGTRLAELALASREGVIAGACHAHLGRASAEAGDVEAACQSVGNEIEEFERYGWELSTTKEDKESMSTAVATAYAFRGTLDGDLNRHDGALAWFSRALKVIESHQDVGKDGGYINVKIQDGIQRIQCFRKHDDTAE